jgi:hypothetical protein
MKTTVEDLSLIFNMNVHLLARGEFVLIDYVTGALVQIQMKYTRGRKQIIHTGSQRSACAFFLKTVRDKKKGSSDVVLESPQIHRIILAPRHNNRLCA